MISKILYSFIRIQYFVNLFFFALYVINLIHLPMAWHVNLI